MRLNLALWFAVLTLFGSVLQGCGDSADPAASTETQAAHVKTIPGGKGGRFATITLEGGGAKPVLHPSGHPPPPGNGWLRDLKKGTGRTAHWGDRISVYYIGVNEDGKPQYWRWSPEKPLIFGLGDEGDAWEEDIKGMKVGGRREIVIQTPAGELDYIVDLLKVY